MNSKNLNPNVSVDCVVFGFDNEKLNILLIEQKPINPSIKPQSALPGDLVLEEESLDDAACRVLHELTGLTGIYLRQFKTFGDPNRVRDVKDLAWLQTYREYPQARVITIAYYALVKMNDFSPEASSFADRVYWCDIHNIPPLAFDHNLIAAEGLLTLRREFEAHRIGFELLPKKFTLSHLQRLYEIILDRKFDKRNFRKKILRENILTPLMEKQQGVYHKPARLYQFNLEELQEHTAFNGNPIAI
ncbi:NUDIX hydrolase [Schleiferia thermophila]|jgi:8-oxo-dGTP diphosphatase|uniref:8-oxo-dGTP diphosphatase n=2 Tax=Schleiferia thermophila TaxID=884107 RepID=A0A369A6U6_9FLAO|nr:NUDIX domain-containing protein [Schleiferia thermophila]KFD39551.1 NUDIX hydrolase [Schleiferia thermophila str. Yellowstone]RCX05072.1 8-oxo-dGTP diphosphatase [Schleiferia thermophila]GCD79410.1 DNA mismatch repair protein MutT [Schleiferia thermophila]